MNRTATTVGARSAYTIIELVIVVALLGLVGALAIPSLVGRSTMEAQAVVRRLVSDIHFAQAEAIAHQSYCRVQFLDGGRGYCLLDIEEAAFGLPFDETTAQYVTDPAGTFGSHGRCLVDYHADDRYATVHIGEVDVDGAGNWITFDALGGIVSEPGIAAGAGRILIEAMNEQWEVLVTPMTGRLVVQRFTG